VQRLTELRPAFGARLALGGARAHAQHRRVCGAPARRGELADLFEQRLTRILRELVGAVEDEEQLAAAGKGVDKRHRRFLEHRLMMQHDDQHVAALGQRSDRGAVLLVDAVHVWSIDQYLRGPRPGRGVVTHHLRCPFAIASLRALDVGLGKLADVGVVRRIDDRLTRGRAVDALAGDAPSGQRVEQGRFSGTGRADQRDYRRALYATDLAVEVSDQTIEFLTSLGQCPQPGDDRDIVVQARAQPIQSSAETARVVHESSPPRHQGTKNSKFKVCHLGVLVSWWSIFVSWCCRSWSWRASAVSRAAVARRWGAVVGSAASVRACAS
jgi:hypothetical protein